MIGWIVVGCSSAPAPAPPAAPQPLGPGDEIDAVDEVGRALHFRIDAVETDGASADITMYSLSVREAPDQPYGPYCGPDAEGRSRAIPLPGSWDTRGDYHHDDPGMITFACTSGAIGKCVRWGYAPWRSAGGRSLADAHLACVRLVRADYCGDGVGHTKDDTQIDVWDVFGVLTREERAGHPEVFEAAWSPAGAVYLGVPRWSDDVAEIVAQCPDKLRGRTSLDGPLDPEEVVRRFPEALLLNARFVRDEDRMR